MSERTGDFLKGLIIGSVAGAVIGILFAPKSGKETREQIAKKTGEWMNKAKEEYELTLEKGKKAYETALHRVKHSEAAAGHKTSASEKTDSSSL
ncbi:MAG: YtxH domain-containing protein [Desulfobacteraceae bacterium]|nr:MAG: YtxH domain-containing protein [Desulfobacteraceae bacterium]